MNQLLGLHITRLLQSVEVAGGHIVQAPAQITLANDEAANLLQGAFGPYVPTPENFSAMMAASELAPGKTLTFTAGPDSATYECIDMDKALSLWSKL